MRTQLVGLGATLATASAAWSQAFVFVGVNLGVPDGDGSGIADPRSIATAGTMLTGLSVQITLSGAGPDGSYNGDLYAYLTHDGITSVLLNRPGRRAEDEFGYADSSGLSVTFDESATRDIHVYRLELSGDHDTPVSGALTGIWQADGRLADPDAVLDTTPRTAGLDGFHGSDPNGEWILFVADLNGGGQARLDSWALSVTAVPELPETGLIAGLGLGAFVVAWRRRRG